LSVTQTLSIVTFEFWTVIVPATSTLAILCPALEVTIDPDAGSCEQGDPAPAVPFAGVGRPQAAGDAKQSVDAETGPAPEVEVGLAPEVGSAPEVEPTRGGLA
jgi:hypothetical protein